MPHDLQTVLCVLEKTYFKGLSPTWMEGLFLSGTLNYLMHSEGKLTLGLIPTSKGSSAGPVYREDC